MFRQEAILILKQELGLCKASKNGTMYSQPLDQMDILQIIDPNVQILLQRLSLELCISENQADAMMKSFNREEQAGKRIPIMISFHIKITKHLMISIIMKAG